MGGNWLQDQFSWKGGTARGDIFMKNIDHGNDRTDRAGDRVGRRRLPLIRPALAALLTVGAVSGCGLI